MKPEILTYIQSQKVGVLAVEMLDGSPHAAAIHFAHTENPLVFYFETSKLTRKAEPVIGREISRASFVIGSDPSNMQTFQVDGEVRLVAEEEKENFMDVYFGKFPNKKEKSLSNPNAIFLIFTPKWWRFTEWKKPEGKVAISSDN
jgi:general stress protein 26